MDKILKTYYVDFNKMEITRFEKDMANVALKMHPTRCFDRQYQAQIALRAHYKDLLNTAKENVKKAYLVTVKTTNKDIHENTTNKA